MKAASGKADGSSPHLVVSGHRAAAWNRLKCGAGRLLRDNRCSNNARRDRSMRFVPAGTRLVTTAWIVFFLPLNPCATDESQEPAALEQLCQNGNLARQLSGLRCSTMFMGHQSGKERSCCRKSPAPGRPGLSEVNRVRFSIRHADPVI